MTTFFFIIIYRICKVFLTR